MAGAPTLTDGVVTLRPHHEDDIPACVEQSQDPDSQRWTRVPIPYELEDARRFIRHAMPGGWATDQEWAFAVQAAGVDGAPRYAGTVSLRNLGDARAEIAYGTHPWARGRGIVEAALRVLLEWGFAERGLETVIWWAHEGNWASRKVAWRLGFSCDGTVRRWTDQRGDLLDSWVGTLLRTDQRAPRNAWYDVPRIVGAQVVLRQHRDNDADRVLEACSDERTAYWLGPLPQPYTRADAEVFVRNRSDAMARGTAVHWVIADPTTDDLLGTVSLMGIGGHSGAEVGYWAHPAARGRGVMSEAVRLVVRHAFIDTEDGGLGFDKLRLVSAVDNPASRHVAEVNGFHEVGTERAGTLCRDGRHDAVIYDLVPGDLS